MQHEIRASANLLYKHLTYRKSYPRGTHAGITRNRVIQQIRLVLCLRLPKRRSKRELVYRKAVFFRKVVAKVVFAVGESERVEMLMVVVMLVL